VTAPDRQTLIEGLRYQMEALGITTEELATSSSSEAPTVCEAAVHLEEQPLRDDLLWSGFARCAHE
jgi:hypothetical protein